MPGIPVHWGIEPRSTLSDSTQLGVKKLGSYTTSAGVETGELREEIYLYNATAAAIVVGQCVLIEYTGLPGTNPQAIALAAKTAIYYHLAVALEAIADLGKGWFAITGPVDALVEGTTDVAIGDFLKVTAGTSSTGLIKDGTTKTEDSYAIAHAAQAANSNVLTKVWLIGDEAEPD